MTFMPNSYGKFIALLVVFFVACLTSCNGTGKSLRNEWTARVTINHINEELLAISFPLALIYAENKQQQDRYCVKDERLEQAAQDFANKQVTDSQTQALKERFYKRKFYCEAIYQPLMKDLEAIIQETQKRHAPPEDAFLFYITEAPYIRKCDWSLVPFVPQCESIIGLFATLESCEKVEAEFRSIDVGTRGCRNWKAEKYYSYRSIGTQKEKLKSAIWNENWWLEINK